MLHDRVQRRHAFVYAEQNLVGRVATHRVPHLWEVRFLASVCRNLRTVPHQAILQDLETP